MLDEWEENLFDASFGGIPINVLSTGDSVPRTVARHLFPFRDGALAIDMGQEARTTSVEIIFFDQGPQDDGSTHIDRMLAFLEVANSGLEQTFIHPITGSYQAFAEGLSFNAQASDRASISLSCTFVETGLERAAFETNEDQTVASGVAAVSEASLDVAAEAEALGIEVTVNEDSLKVAQGWADAGEEITPRQVSLELNYMANQIEAETERFQLATRVDRYPMLLAFHRLQASMRKAAALTQSAAPATRQVVTDRPTSLLAFVNDRFGGANANAQYLRTRQLNRIENPSYIPAGTTIIVEVVG